MTASNSHRRCRSAFFSSSRSLESDPSAKERGLLHLCNCNNIRKSLYPILNHHGTCTALGSLVAGKRWPSAVSVRRACCGRRLGVHAPPGDEPIALPHRQVCCNLSYLSFFSVFLSSHNQPLRLDIKKKLSASSERVKSVDLHSSEPWVLAALYSGNVMIWDYESGSLAKSFEVSDLPIRCAKFVARKQWFLAASDDMRMRVFNYNTMEKIKDFEAHADYIRSLEVHPTLPYVLSSSDDMTIKLWDWDRGFDCTQLFEGHAHYVMQVKINPKDTNTFASASLDRTIKVWGLGSHVPHYTLEGHERGVNCVDYYPSGDKPYILSGADDRTVKIWDYQVRDSFE
jgi:WD40 repeat protein